MNELIYKSAFRDETLLREAFFALAKQVFGIDFIPWYERGLWPDTYIPHAFFKNGLMIANVSVTLMTMVFSGKEYRVAQIGTVMTHEEYRNRGLARQLMLKVLDLYSAETDFIYLFAHPGVRDFYPKFGFVKAEMTGFRYECSFCPVKSSFTDDYQPVTMNDLVPDSHFRDLIDKSLPVSHHGGVVHNKIVYFYLMNGFARHLHYDSQNGVLLLMEMKEGVVHLYDIFFHDQCQAVRALRKLSVSGIKGIRFYFNPDLTGLDYVTEKYESEDTLFCYPLIPALESSFMFPITSTT